ncbi:MAG: segregation/condensation protein A [Fluviicoccus sp.]|uniref:segregation and condensation protein A n=1 Tax=Fluviicoccus sp. TaxID=2003552 RepID=UPI00271B5258|nr:segregation/condensation protein A [Fluviicoccus sp.]MDO8331825.1 segregation/condensation protein A [Fluviicoccus sp.]
MASLSAPEAEVAPEIIAEVIARVYGEAVTELPEDLYIPPDALAVVLEAFEGPLDLLLYLIRKQNLDILDIPISRITDQYLAYIDLMQVLHIDLAAEYLLMAALLAEIKSRMLLPKPVQTGDEEDDPRAELVRRLQEYERFKKAAEDLDTLPQEGRDIFPALADAPLKIVVSEELMIGDLPGLLDAMRDILRRAELRQSHVIGSEGLTLEQRLREVLERLQDDSLVMFHELFFLQEGRMGVVVTFMAILELLKQKMITLVQESVFAQIYVRRMDPQSAEAAWA